MHIPEDFLERFNDEFGANYRIRWSEARHEYHVEQKVGRGKAEGFVDTSARTLEDYRLNHDDRIRARDGYILTFAVAQGTHTFCTECSTKIAIPTMRFEAVQCPYCAMKGRQRLTDVAYFPLGESLLDHLRKIDVFNGGNERVREAVQRRAQFLEAEASADLRRRVDAGVRERFNRLVGIPSWGYTGKERAWDKPLATVLKG